MSDQQHDPYGEQQPRRPRPGSGRQEPAAQPPNPQPFNPQPWPAQPPNPQAAPDQPQWSGQQPASQPQWSGQPWSSQPYGSGQQPVPGQPPAGVVTPWQPEPPRRRRRAALLSAAAVVVLGAGGVATYAAVSDGGTGGAASPQDAARSVVADINDSDLVGFLDDLAPGERDALAGPIGTLVDQLKRNDVLSAGADPGKVTGLHVQVKDLTFAPSTIRINDHVQLVQLTGGTLVTSGSIADAPLSTQFLNAVAPGAGNERGGATVDIAEALRASGEKSALIATQKVDGSWYPSLFYTIAANAVRHRGAPTAADAIPARGAATPEQAVTTLVASLLRGDGTSAVGVLSPEEFAVLHDYGHLIVPARFDSPAAGARISDVTTSVTDLDGGRKRVLVTGVTVRFEGETVRVHRDGSCISADRGGVTVHFCPGRSGETSVGRLVEEEVGKRLTARQLTAVNDVFAGTDKAGIVVSQTGGSWYVDPVRSVLGDVNAVLGGLRSGDMLALISIGD